jgi:hypothetical protein
VRDLQSLMRDLFEVVQEYVEIYVAWAFVKRSFPAEVVLNVLENIK